MTIQRLPASIPQGQPIRAEVIISTAMKSRLRHRYLALAWLALAWAVGNALYMYLVLNGDRAYRVESASFILVGVLLPLIFWRPLTDERGTALTLTDNRWLMLLAVILWLVTLAPFLTLPFLSDDYVFLHRFKRFSDVLNVAQFFRPMFAFVFILLARTGNGSTVPFHVASLLVHGASAWCVYVLSRRLFSRTDAAVFCFAVFLLNPLQLEAVLWVSGLQDLLWTAFALAGLVVYTGAQILSLSRLAVTLLFIGCALLSKETAVSVVLLLPATDWAFFRMKRGNLLPAAYIGLGIVAVAYLFARRARVTSVESSFFVTPGKYFVQKFVGMPYKFFVQPLNVTAATIPLFVFGCVTVNAFAVLFGAVLRGAGPMMLTGPAVILISTLPVYAYFWVEPDLRGTRYLYFPAVGWAVLVSQLLTTLFSRRRSLVLGFASFIVFLFASLQVNVKPWPTAGAIVIEVAKAIRERKPLDAEVLTWRARYGDGLEVKDGIPTVYRGVFVLYAGYPELREMLTEDNQ
jgi:hypothetical protein